MFQIEEPGTHKRPTAVGIDLGTTCSLVAISNEGKPQLLTDVDRESVIPSVVSYGEDVVRSVKRLMGHTLLEVETYVQKSEFLLSEEQNMVMLHVGDEKKSPIDVSADILKKVKKQAEEALGREVLEAVITVPAYFNENQRQATKEAAKKAGLTALRLLSEPTAAALAYGLDNADRRGTFLVYDLGGGTFDVSVLKLTDGVFKVIATGGDTYLGGDDIDHIISEKLGCDMQKAKAYKEELCRELETSDGALTRQKLDSWSRALLHKTLAICFDVLEESGVESTDLDGVIMVGGSTRMPLVKTLLHDSFGSIIKDEMNPEEVVALGAAIQAENLSTASNSALLLDVTPLSLGLETMGGLVEKIIDRNTPIPIAKAQEFTTFKDNQTGMEIHVLQGERETVEGCRSLAKFTLKGIPPMPAGQARIRVTFSLDADGLLTVAAMEETTGEEQVIEVSPSYGISSEEVVDMLKVSFNHAKQDVEQRQVREVKLELERLCDLCDSMIENDGHLIEDIDQLHGMAQATEGARVFLTMDSLEDVQHALEELEITFQPLSELKANDALRTALVGEKIDEVK